MFLLIPDIIDKLNLKRTALLLPFITSFFYLFIRNLSTTSLYIACIIGLSLTLFPNRDVNNCKTVLSWGKIVVLMLLLLLVSFGFYYFSNISASYLKSPYSIVLTIIPFFVFFRRLDKEESLIYALIFLFIFSGILSYWFGVHGEYGDRVISSRYFKLLYFAPLLIVFKWMKLDLSMYIAIVVMGLFGVLLTIIITFYYYEYADGGVIDVFTHQVNVSANTNPIFFGLISLTLTLPIYLAIFLGELEKRSRFVLVIMMLVGISGVLASGSRGVWVALFLSLSVYFMCFMFNRDLTKFKKLVSIISIILIGAVFINSQQFRDRAEQAIEDVENYHLYENSQQVKIENSLGTRFELWKAAIKIFREHALIGVGPGEYSSELKKLADNNDLNPDFVIYNQAHNQYFHTLATKGLLGIIVLLSFLTVLMWTSIKRILAVVKLNNTTKYLAYSGFSIILVYALLSFTESPFERRSTIVFFTFFYSLTFAAMKTSELRIVK